MFSLKGTLLKAFGLADKDGETDVEAWTRIQEAMDAEKTKVTDEAKAAERSFTETVSAINARLDESAKTITALQTSITTIEASCNKTIADLKTQFAKDLATVKAGSEPITTEDEMKPTDPKVKDGGIKVGAWKKNIVSVKQHV